MQYRDFLAVSNVETSATINNPTDRIHSFIEPRIQIVTVHSIKFRHVDIVKEVLLNLASEIFEDEEKSTKPYIDSSLSLPMPQDDKFSCYPNAFVPPKN